MKRSPLLHADISYLIATLGHGDTIVIGDAGLPIPTGPQRIDLAVLRGVPTLAQTLQAVLSEMVVEGSVIAQEAPLAANGLPAWYPTELAGVRPQTVSHEEFKRLTQSARAIIRTGECTPYANIILRAGVAF
ncbi:D-ribose pyranase [Curvibacter sp. CHRR-16]|uniref:D-ribose pyranase n=1 Tax=Curvibacter sp. CHRR-16 TaxID=2835872 RepID=UPI001BD9FF87|nr:D-ribose pyranase [Curvibacter sp. CHRR-16]MBT0570556.1 D-ribose pyranase [Curvibacter sp. CHRR-16]